MQHLRPIERLFLVTEAPEEIVAPARTEYVSLRADLLAAEHRCRQLEGKLREMETR